MDFPPPLVQHRTLFPAPIVQKTLAPFRNVVRRVFALGHHIHACPSCGAEWSHADTNVSNTAAHTCPGCNKILPGNWKPTASNMKIEVVQVPAAAAPKESPKAAPASDTKSGAPVVASAPPTSAPVYNSTCPGGNCPQNQSTGFQGGFLRRIFGR